jgi:hypothetical protein
MSELTLQTARKLDPRKIGLGLAALWAIFAVIGLVAARGHFEWALQTVNPQHSSLDLQVSTTAILTSALMLGAAGMAFALAGVDRTRRSLRWRRAGWAFVVLGVDALVGVHAWLQSQGVSWAAACLPLVLVAGLALATAVQIFRSQRSVQVAFGAAIALWLAAALVDNPTVPGSEGAAEMLAMAAAIVFALTLLARLRYLARQYYPLEERETRLSVDQIAAEILDRLPLRRVAIVLGVLVAAESIQYLLLHVPGYPHCPSVLDACHARDAEKIGILDLNNEQTLETMFQMYLLLAAGVAALVVGRLRVTAAEMKRWWIVLGLVLVFLGANQVLAMHNRFGDATDLPGQVILVPVAIAGVVSWLKVLRAIWGNRFARALFIAGAVVWIYSQASDLAFDAGHAWTTTPEETGESTGSLLWLLSILAWMRAALPVGLMPPERALSSNASHTLITPLPETGQASRTPTG